MKNLALAILFLILNIYSTAAQMVQCGQNHITEQLENKYPGISELIDKTYQEAIANPSDTRMVYTIPVVVHIIYNDAGENLSDELIQSQIDVLNQDFRRMNEDASMTRSVFEDVAGDAEIEFVLASQDPNGNQTNGITRTETERTSFIDLDITQLLAALLECGIDITNPEITEEQLECIFESLGDIDLDQMKSSSTGGTDPWDTKRYMNIWVCNLALDLGGMDLPFLLGFAYPPVGAPNWPAGTIPDDIENKDGVAVHYQVFGLNNPNIGTLAGISDKGRTTTHEVGHYLGLRHIWGDGDCTMDDGLEDTPPAGSNSQPADGSIPSCETLHEKDSCLEDALPDMIENYMDYSLESCQNMFTKEQIGIMRAMLEGPRVELLDAMVNTEPLTIINQLIIHPNPTEQDINIFLPTGMSSEFTLYSLEGKPLLHAQLDPGDQTINLPRLAKGIYLGYFLHDNGQSQIKKIIKK